MPTTQLVITGTEALGMKKHNCVYVLAVLAALCISPKILYADQCDDLFAKACNISESAKQAAIQINYDRAAELYQEAAEYYGQVANIKDCRWPKIVDASQYNARFCREMADKYREIAKEYAAEKQAYNDYNRALEKFNLGNTYVRNRQWDKAVAAYEEAASIWEGVSAATQSENGKRAAKAAQQARDAANLARQYQQRQ